MSSRDLDDTKTADVGRIVLAPERLHALVVGIDAYAHWRRLKCGRADAENFARALTACCGFPSDAKHLRLLLDGEATYDALQQALADFVAMLTPEDALVIYYAGHGHRDAQTQAGYWAPVDAPGPGSLRGLLSHDDLKRTLRAVRARHLTVVCDACFGGLLFTRESLPAPHVVPGYFARAFGTPSRIGLTSGNDEPVPDEGVQGHSLFNFKLCRLLEHGPERAWTPRTLHARLVQEVPTGLLQCERLDDPSHQGGEFVFFRVGGAAAGTMTMDRALAESEAAQEPQKVRVEEYEIRPIEIAVEWVESGVSSPPELPPVDRESVRLWGEVESLKQAIAAVESGTHPALAQACANVEQAAAQYEALHLDADRNRGALGAKHMQKIEESFAQEQAPSSLAPLLRDVPTGWEPRAYMALVLRCRNAGRARRIRDRVRAEYERMVAAEMQRMRGELAEKTEALKRAQLAEYDTLLIGFLERHTGDDFPADAFFVFEEQLSSRSYAWDYGEAWAHAEKLWAETRRESAAWSSTQAAATRQAFEAYLSEFPAGRNAPQAKERLAREREEAARRAAAEAELQAWAKRERERQLAEELKDQRHKEELPAAIQTTRRIGNFEIIRDIGKGAEGRVVEARCLKSDPAIPGLAVGMTVALKVMPDRDLDPDVFRRRLCKQTAALKHITHANVVRYYGCFAQKEGVEQDNVVIIECLRGCTLRDKLRQAPRGLDADVVVRVFHDCLAGLACAAEHGIIHRDIKPSNIFLCDDGTTKLIDFELARHATGTQTGADQGSMRGTIRYMAPEFHPSFRPDPDFRGDAVSDIFSLAVCLFEALAGHLPYANAKSTAVEDEMLAFFDRWGGPTGATGALVDIGKQRALHPLVHIEALLGKGLAIRRDDRFATYAEMQQMYERVKPREIAHGPNRYTLLRVIGHGGFAEVFKARREQDGLLVAVKSLTALSQGERFAREARLLASVVDPRIVRFIEFIPVSQLAVERQFLVMELLSGMPGWSLHDRLVKVRHSGLPLQEVLTIFQRYAQALVILHRQGNIHRDIKPSHLYAPADNPDSAKVYSLLIARDEKDPTLTGRGLPGTPDYWPPEVSKVGYRGDPRMDIYALGLCLFEALVGRPAFPRLPRQDDLALQAFLKRARSKPLPSFDDPTIAAHPQLQQLLRAMLEPDPELRLADADQVARILCVIQSAVRAAAWEARGMQSGPKA